VSGSSARDQSVDELEGVGRTSPRGQVGAGALPVWVWDGHCYHPDRECSTREAWDARERAQR
jgi:hypothetical protein